MTHNDNKIYGVAALFDNPDKIIKAVKKVKSDGYKYYDVNTPYPLHGMDDAMGLRPSRLGYVTLFFGFAAAVFILSFMWWTLAISYPLVIGGKPYFALPAFVPITFEFTVLLGVLSTVIGMITVVFNLPFNSHPLHDTEYMRNVSADKYGIVIESADPLFEETKVRGYLKNLGAFFTETIYEPEKETYKIFQPKFLVFLGVIAILTSGSTYVTLNKFMYLTPFDFMLNQKKGSAQAESNFFYDKREMRTPVEGTVARGYIPYAFKGQADPKEFLSNPLLPTMKNLQLGQKKFLTYCSPCHGYYGDGDSRLRGQFPAGPTLHSARVIGFSDGKIYNIITNGQNVMPSYAYQITRNERWAIINYIRVLQRAQNPEPSDFTDIKEINKESDKNVPN